MGCERRPYDEADSTGRMTLDCLACAAHVRLPRAQRALDPAGVAAGAPRLDYAADARGKRKTDLDVSDAAAHLASRLHLHLD